MGDDHHQLFPRPASEIRGLLLADFNRKSRELRIRRQKGSLETTRAVFKMRGEPLLDEYTAVMAWLEERPKDDHSPYLFTSQKSGALDRTAFSRMFQDVAADADIPTAECNPRVLKRSLGSHLVEQNRPITEVARRLGHVSIKSMMFYVGCTDAQATAGTENALSELF